MTTTFRGTNHEYVQARQELGWGVGGGVGGGGGGGGEEGSKIVEENKTKGKEKIQNFTCIKIAHKNNNNKKKNIANMGNSKG